MTRIGLRKFVLFVSLLCAVFAQAQVLDRRALPQRQPLPALQEEQFLAAYHAGDVDKLMSTLMPDALFVNEYDAAYRGADLRSYMMSLAKVWEGELHLQSGGLTVAGDIAIERGTFTEDRHVRSTGATQHFHGTYVLDAQRQASGVWLFRRIELHADQPNRST